MKLAVITAIFGAYDAVPPVPQGFSEAVLVSDRPIESAWTNIVLDTDLPPRFASKIPKFRPDLFTKTRASVWVDASMRDPDNWLYLASKRNLSKHDLVLFRHPERSKVEEEVMASRLVDKYDQFPLEEQFETYLAQGFPDESGLWAGGVIARIHSDQNVELGNEWLMQNARWSIQDQLSLPYIVWKNDLNVGIFEEHQYTGPLKWIHHYGEISLGKKLNLQYKEPTYFRIQLGTAIKLLLARRNKELFIALKRVTNSFVSKVTSRGRFLLVDHISVCVRGTKYLLNLLKHGIRLLLHGEGREFLQGLKRTIKFWK